jgi:hypothetical protein
VRKITSVGWPPTQGIFRVLNELYGICAAGVLGDARVRVVDVVVLIEHHVFEHGAETKRLEDVGFALGCKVDGLGVAAAFDVKDAVVAPAMLVIADEMALRIGGKRRLARATETEEQRRHTGLLVRRR